MHYFVPKIRELWFIYCLIEQIRYLLFCFTVAEIDFPVYMQFLDESECHLIVLCLPDES